MTRRLPEWPAHSADALERELLERWTGEGLFARVQAQTQDGPPFVFYEGPPTANGRPGIHHVFARTIKDLVCRYHAMQGQRVTRIAGWDTHGLPVEIEVEKELGLSGKKQIEAFGVEPFNAKARASVFRYQEEWENLSDRIGYWLDYERPYITYSNNYIESVWWLLRQLHDKGLLYRGHRVLPYCPRCGTVLSSHELALGYEEVADRSIYVSFPLDDGSGRELVVWTTTPWTLPSNVAVAVHPEMAYAQVTVQATGRTFILAPSAIAKLWDASAVSVGAPVQGSALVGLRYTRPLDVVPVPEDAKHGVVVPGDFVTADDGSGMVHLAPAFGADDFAAGQEHGLAFLRPVAPDGTFSGTTWPELEGRLVTADETQTLIIKRLKEAGRWLHTEQHVHSYPHCWRCKSKLIYYARDSWFVRTSAVKARMLEINRGVDWNPPEVGSGRFGEWLENNVDWALSRDRYWGTPLPVWVSDTDPTVVQVIGSYAELAEKSGRALAADFDPHKPFIDAITWPAPNGGVMRRTPEVIDAWFDSGAMPYAQWHYPFENQAEFTSHFPADYICEGLDQTRGWFYSLLAIATTVFDSPAYKHVIVNGLVLDADGQKMSKTRGNTVNPWDVVEQFGADVVRLYLLASGQVWLPKRFDARTIPDVAGGFLITLRETYGFYRLYAGDWTPGAEAAPSTRPLADRWILSRLASTVAAVRTAWDGYDVTAGVRAIMDFVVEDLSKWYVRRNKPRFWAPDRTADPDAVATLHEALVTVARLLAPAAPFASDWLHRALTGESAHVAPFPEAQTARADLSLEAAMDAVRRLASLGRAAREEGKIRVRQPVAGMKVAVPPQVRGPLFDELLPILQDEVNAKRIEPVDSEAALVALRPKANFRSLGKRFGKRTAEIAAAVGTLGPEPLRALESGRDVPLPIGDETVTILPEDVVVERAVATDWLVTSSGPYVAAVDPRLTDELRREGLARELVSRVQRFRKDAGFDYAERIALWIDGDEPVREAARAYEAFIRDETLARTLTVGRNGTQPADEQTLEIDGLRAVIGVQRHSGGHATADS